MRGLEVKGSKTNFEIIKIDSIPDEIEQQEAEKVCLSNLILEFFRASDPPFTELELVCNSTRVEDQLHDGEPHFFIVVYLMEIESFDKEYRKSFLKARVDAMLQVLRRMGYMASRNETSPIESTQFFPDGLMNRQISMVYNTDIPTDHQLLSIGVTAAFDNLITMMADIPDSMFSIMIRGYNDQVGFSIQVFALEEMQADFIYLNFIQGMKKTFLPERSKGIIKNISDYWRLFRLDRSFPFAIMSYGELSNVLQLPFGRRSGIPITPQQRRLPLFEHGLINGNDVPMGEVVGSVGKKLTLPLQRQVSHISVLGISGSGKSNFLLHYLNEMYNNYDIPFLIIDPVSTEFRTLKCSLKGKHLNVFTPGSEVSPFEFNLFALSCENLSIHEYKMVLKDYMRNSLQLFSPLDKLIDETVDSIFLQKGWLDVSTKNFRPGRTFSIDDFIETFNQVFEKSKFKGNLENMASSGRVRLKSLRSYFNSVTPMPLSDLMSVPTVVELGKLQSAEAKSTMLLYLLSMVKLYMMENAARIRRETGDTQVRKPCLILVIDEAHSILEMQEQGEGMNIAQRGVVNTINQMLLEYRKYGLSVVISDQRVSVLQDVLTNTHVQVIFKQIDPIGKQVASDIISLDEVQMLSMQKRGVAFVKHEKLETPIQVQMPKYDYVTDTSDECVAAYMEQDFWQGHFELTRPFEECSQCSLKEQMCNRKLRSIVANIAEKYLNMNSQLTRKTLAKAAIQKDDPLAKDLLKQWGIVTKKNAFIERCLRIHLLHASKLLSSEKK